MLKRNIISCLMAFAVISSALTPFNCFAENTSENDVSYTDEQGNTVYVTEDGFEYTIENDEITITKYTGDAVYLTIPDYIDGLPVTTIGDGKNNLCGNLEKNTTIKKIQLPKTAKTLDYYAFYYFSELTEIELNEGLEKIKYSCFDVTAIETLTIPSTVNDCYNELRYLKNLKQLTVYTQKFDIVNLHLVDNVNVLTYKNRACGQKVGH